MKFCYDSGHDNICNDCTDLLKTYGYMLAALHLQDNNGKMDQHLLLGEGCFDWDIFAKKLAGTGYQGSMTLESVCTKPDKITAEEYLKKAYSLAFELVKKMDKPLKK